MIRFENVQKQFGSKKVLRGLNLQVEEGDVYFVLGASGTGKSVALKSLVGLVNIDSGSITYRGQSLEKYSEEEFQALRREVSMVFQLPALLDSRTLLENLNLPIRALPSKERWTRIKEALHATKLADYLPSLASLFPTSLSYGEQKRMALARSLVAKPAVLLYDEPTTGMDSETAREIHELIQEVAQKFSTTSIVVSHDIENALKFANKISVMNEGVSIFSGTPESLRQNTHPVIDAFLKSSHQRAKSPETAP